MFSTVRRPLFRSFALALLSLALGAVDARAEFIVALGSTTDLTGAVTTLNALATFDSAAPGTSTNVLSISGVSGKLIDIDFRPATGQLYGLSDNSQLYTINITTGLASPVTTLSTLLSGSQFGIDFNPTVDRLRIVGNTGQNLRVNVDSGAVTVDTNLSLTGIVAAAYANSFPGATTTTLYDLQRTNSTFFSLVTQTNPNGGTFGSPLTTTISASNSLVGFDISGKTGVAYVATGSPVGVGSSLYALDLTSGIGTSLGSIGSSSFQVRGLAAPVGSAAVPEPASLAMLGFGLAGVACLARRRAKRSA